MYIYIYIQIYMYNVQPPDSLLLLPGNYTWAYTDSHIFFNPRHLLAMRLAAGLAPMHLLLAALTRAFQQGPQRDFEHDLAVRESGESGWRNTDFTSQHWNLMGSYYGI